VNTIAVQSPDDSYPAMLRELWPQVLSEVAQLLKLADGPISCLATGSLAEGLGNRNSDIDLYVVTPDTGKRRSQSTSIGMRGSRYVDCEFITVESLTALADRIRSADWATIASLQAKDFDRYYRTSIGIHVVRQPALDSLFERFDKEIACNAYGMWCAAQTLVTLGVAEMLFTSGRVLPAAVHLRAALHWELIRTLANQGQGYPSTKWTMEKAARLSADGSRFDEAALDVGTDTSQVGHGIQALAERFTAPPELLASLDRSDWGLRAGVKLVETEAVSYLTAGSKSIVKLTGPLAGVCALLAAGQEWRAATEHVAERLGMSAQMLRLAISPDLQKLHVAGFVQILTAEESVNA
jgi:hypothetical protein